ncbi:hypothetical protein MUK42_00001 [Musa troglodytarum]|uniref:Uncharacterized protein n=1 Tax=Musa troglodytarum TaxID=320322 RepID=A0A9E7G8B9_9LILI|nr:hypothetical protein MUK42_00001 [Musa troglodytarum]
MSFIFKVVDIPWYGKKLPSTEADKYEPFFNPRKSVNLSNLGEIPLARKSNGFSLQTDAIVAQLLNIRNNVIACLLSASHHLWWTRICSATTMKEPYEQGIRHIIFGLQRQLKILHIPSLTTFLAIYKVIKVLHFSSMTNAFQGFNDEVRFAALLLPQVKTQKTGIEEAVYSGISILVRGNTKILYQIHVAWYRLQRG